MTDTTPIPADGDVPVNPYSLMESVNETSEDARTGWFIFIALMTYLLVAVAGIGHKELLLSKDVPLPIIQVSIDLQRFFLFAPIVLCFLHFGLLLQHAMLARKVIEFNTALQALEPTDLARHPLRLELHSYFFTQALAGPQRSPLMSFFLHAQSWLTLVALPVLLLLYIQVTFLPYHDVDITWAHRLTLLADILLLLAIGFFLIRVDTSFWHAFGRTLVHHPLTFGMTSLLLALIAGFALFVATVPGESLDRVTKMMTGPDRAPAAPALLQSTELAGRFWRFAVTSADGRIFGFRRNLVVTDANLVDDRTVVDGQATLNFRNRDLRFARLDRSDLHQSDLTGANLDGASLVGADLRKTAMSCLDIDALNLGDRPNAHCTSLKGANLSRVKGGAAKLEGADLTNARFEAAQLDEADLSYAILTGANFGNASVKRADFTGGVAMQGANFLIAQMQGADLTGANLQGADFSSAGLQAAIFKNAKLHGANFTGAELDGADLSGAKLAGADFSGAKLFGADLKGASVWQTQPAVPEMIELADLADVMVAPLEDNELASLRSLIEKTENSTTKATIQDALAGVLDKGSAGRWQASAEYTQWRALVSKGAKADGDPYRGQLTSFLGGLMCRARWSNGSVATGVVKRALGSSFKGSAETLYGRLTLPECPASQAMSKQLMRDLSAALDNAKGLQTASGLGPLVGPNPVGSR